MSAISSVFSKDKSVFIPYISLGDPDYESCVAWADALIRGGAGILELGIPFTDPTADGPVIQKAFKRALAHPFSMKKILEITAEIHKLHPQTPLVYLTYFNPLYAMGLERFAEIAKNSGIQGLIIPDLPYDTPEAEEFFTQLEKRKIDFIHLVTPATTEERIKSMKSLASGFIYYVTSYGVTGERSSIANGLRERIGLVKKLISLPVCAGFGISTAVQSKEISQYADGVIIGSAVQRIIEENGSNRDACVQKLFSYASEIRSSMR
ncbi:tryptophan synthase subunit alpha [Leptospira yasudae]|uniref:tryptophan synthase subunit alpha n=1 Tax=Leptospira yasudae TaxID=2202201 RepID=UPI000E59F09E|nr:tryptophan synthase subunit alpha [Leptospira yasudae]MBW0433957.1 tryptophan synthase subunit alpha [Leptospira yasudae]RHX94609.1 tryptophan synthase subunit alpha [Leptospira yasudae]TGK24358.1 tryptophan synthase subunit alpha [Leptospira yasudae]TGM05854.1 tryptophan synthase subunit alpha [Leptospira yasudae]TGM95759.1 tryptophan synthase subunit alpha [Leptospira yasudae]